VENKTATGVTDEAIFQFRKNFLDVGINIPESKVIAEIENRFLRSKLIPEESSFWGDHPEVAFQDGYSFFLDEVGFWQTLFVVDDKQQIVDCRKVNQWIFIVSTNHAIERFLKHSSQMHRYYETRILAEDDLLTRISASVLVESNMMRNGEKKTRHGKNKDFYYSLEESNDSKAPLLFIVENGLDRKNRPTLVIITCYFFRGDGASRHKPKARDRRAEEKRTWRKLATNHLEEQE